MKIIYGFRGIVFELAVRLNNAPFRCNNLTIFLLQLHLNLFKFSFLEVFKDLFLLKIWDQNVFGDFHQLPQELRKRRWSLESLDAQSLNEVFRHLGRDIHQIEGGEALGDRVITQNSPDQHGIWLNWLVRIEVLAQGAHVGQQLQNLLSGRNTAVEDVRARISHL